jgi:hypothetical protein
MAPDGKPQVILAPPFTFTINNVDKFNFCCPTCGGAASRRPHTFD